VISSLPSLGYQFVASQKGNLFLKCSENLKDSLDSPKYIGS